ncbi:MAG: response regulator [Treponema sp.]|nr:response regulator [Treponema sp.]
MTVTNVVVAIMVGLIVLGIADNILDRRMETDYVAKGNAVAKTVASIVNGGIIDRYLNTLETDAEYETILSHLRTMQREHGLLYICVIKMAEEGEVLVFGTGEVEEGTSALGIFISWVDSFGEGHDDYIEKLLRGERVGTLVSNGIYGWILSIYVPIYRDDRSAAAYACVDISMDQFKREKTVVFTLIGIGVLLVLFLTIAASLFTFRRYILSPISILLDHSASVHIAGRDSSKETPLQARLKYGDELAVLERAIIDMELRIDSEVAERFRVEEKYKTEMEEQIEKMSKLLNGLDEIIFITVPHTGEILFVNDYLKNHFNIEGGLIGKFCYEIFMKDKDGICDFCPCYQLDKEPGSSVVWEMINPITNRVYRNTNRYIEWPDGRIVQIEHSVDVTELVAAREQAEQGSRFKSQFLSRMSHEIRTPMNAILGITEIQLQDETLPRGLRDALDRIYNSGYLLLGIINDILDLSKIEAGKLELLLAAYNVQSLINDIVHLNIMQYNNKPIKFNLQVDENIPSTLYGDELRIKQILNNLLSNAFKYTDEGEVSLLIAAEYGPEKEAPQVTLVFRVKDTGQGLTAEQRDSLFDEYNRFNTESNRVIEGTGLGMAITKHLVLMMDGEISVESEPGKGSAFTARLPQGIAGGGVLGREMAENLRQFHLGNAGQMKKAPQIEREYMPYGRVLIVDDVESNLYVARGLMAPYGLSLETASSGLEAVKKIKNGSSFDIIFMDHFMPEMDGIEAAGIIRGLGYAHPIIALTANALMGQAEMFMENGFDGFISKPIDIRQLDFSLNKYIRDKQPPEKLETARRQALKIKMVRSGAKEGQTASNSELAAIFTRDAEKALERLDAIHINAYRGADDIRMYVINVHAIKSALANIGETDLSAAALKLEQAGRDEDIKVMTVETPAFLERLREVIEKNKVKEDDDTLQEESESERLYLSKKLLVIKKACEEYDEMTARTILAELGQKRWRHSAKKLLDVIGEHLLHSDFEEAAELAEGYMKNGLV